MRRIALLTTAMVLAFIPFAFAEGPHGNPDSPGAPEMGGPPDMMMDKGFMKALDEIGLTEDQEQKLREIHGSNKRDILNLRHEIQLAVLDIQDEYKKEKSDEGRINSFIDKISAAQTKLMKIRSSQMLKMKAVLTPEQFKKLTDKMDRVKPKAKKGFFDNFMKKK